MPRRDLGKPQSHWDATLAVVVVAPRDSRAVFSKADAVADARGNRHKGLASRDTMIATEYSESPHQIDLDFSWRDICFRFISSRMRLRIRISPGVISTSSSS